MSDWSARLSDLRALLADKLGVMGADLGHQVRRAGRRLPRRVRREAEFLVRAEEMARHPRLARLIDPREVARAQGRVARHLEGINPALLRRNRRKDRVAAFALYVLVTSALVVTLLWWRGYV
jgi:hypothetical protein